MIEIICSFILIIASFLFFVASVGLLRLPDAMCRAHAVAKASCLGILLILVVMSFRIEGKQVYLFLLTTAVFQFLTIPISAHLFGRLAFYKKIDLWREEEMNHFSQILEEEEKEGKNF